MNYGAGTPTAADLRDFVSRKHDGDSGRYGWATRMRLSFDYFTPDEVYEATVERMVAPGTTWLDVGCGRNVFPSNPGLARVLADRCRRLVGVDPDETIEENTFVHERVCATIDTFESTERFDIVTLRMVAEHVADPEATLQTLARLTKPGGSVVIYTVNQWAPASVVARAVPFSLHHAIKHWLWKTDEKDTFPVAYRMNTRRRLRRLFETHGFHEASFVYLDDCRSFGNTRALLRLELSACHVFRSLGFTYPENCLLGVYLRNEQLGS